ncbi:MAG: hypothetical protein LAO06_20950, partial [Acidobacteriia bacterium]|nr:hypothetical protein [Terriglobia bacterium]
MSGFDKARYPKVRPGKHSLLRCALGALIAGAFVISAAGAARADSVSLVTSTAAQQPNDSVPWSQLGSNATVLQPSFPATSVNGVSVNVGLGGANSLVSVVCPASSCSWSGLGMPSGDSLIWTSNGSNGGNGPVTMTFTNPRAGAGAFIQANGPGTFTAQIQAFHNATSLGSFTETSDSSGHAIYIGILDSTGPNITSVIFSLTQAQGSLADFALNRLYLNGAVPATPTSTVAPTFVAPSRTATPTATATAPPGAIAFVGSSNTTTAGIAVPSGVQNGDLLLAFYS